MHVKDAARAFADLLASDFRGSVNIASGECRPVAALIEEIGRQTGRADLIRLDDSEPRRIAALRHSRVTAPFVLDGAMNGEIFKAYVEQFLAPTLKSGDIVFMDNVSVHKVDGVEEAIEARGAIAFYLPPYSGLAPVWWTVWDLASV